MRNSLWILFFVSIAFAFSSCSSSSSSSLVGNWTSRSSLDGYPRTGAIAFTIGNYAYLGLGYNATKYNYYTDLWRYDPSSSTGGEWTKMTAFPGVGRSNAVAFVINGVAYVGTGMSYDKTSGNNTYYQDIFKYTPDANGGTWARVADFPDKRYYACAFTVGGKGYVGTGKLYDGTDELYQKTFYMYDPTGNTWTSVPFEGEKRYGASTFVINDKAYLVGGYGTSGLVYDFYQFDPTSSGWTRKRDIKNTSSDSYDDSYTDIMRYGAAGFASSTKGYLTCGQSNSILQVTWEYDPTNDLWTKKTSFEGAGRKNTVGFAINGRLYVATGEQGSTYFDDNWEFKPNEEYDENN
jgi:Uncharacterized protein conserved in bacteria